MLPEAKTSVNWQNRDTILVGTTLAPASTTTSGYPRQVRKWRRGDAFERSEVVFEGDERDMGVWCGRDHERGAPRTIISRALDFIHREVSFQDGDGPLTRLDIPLDAEYELAGDRLVIKLRMDWQPADERYEAGSVLVGSLARIARRRHQNSRCCSGQGPARAAAPSWRRAAASC